MVEILVAVAIGLVVPALAMLLVALVYRVARGAPLRISRTTNLIFALLYLASAIVGFWSSFTDQSTSGPNIPLQLSVLNGLLTMGLWVISRSLWQRRAA